ncbi:hypothetical protein K2X40_01670 [Candidatus Babeliales bacterium]|nr:hypothetical protein [Candidatus Babeliales bacterium]
MKKLPNLMLIIGLLAGSLHGAATSPFEHYCQLGKSKKEKLFQLAIVNQDYIARKIVALQNDTTKTITELNEEYPKLRKEQTQAEDIIGCYSNCSFAQFIIEKTRLQLNYADEQKEPMIHLLQQITLITNHINKIKLEMAKLEWCVKPRKKFERPWRDYLGKTPRKSSHRKAAMINHHNNAQLKKRLYHENI